jgi:hypothetical protein
MCDESLPKGTVIPDEFWFFRTRIPVPVPPAAAKKTIQNIIKEDIRWNRTDIKDFKS